jgi:hypothetical protein
MSMAVVEFVVGGISYPLDKRDIENYPDSFLFAAVEKEQHDGKKIQIVVERDAMLFKHVHAYIVNGYLSKAVRSCDDGTLLEAVRLEAEFFGLHDLVEACMHGGPCRRKQRGL